MRSGVADRIARREALSFVRRRKKDVPLRRDDGRVRTAAVSARGESIDRTARTRIFERLLAAVMRLSKHELQGPSC